MATHIDIHTPIGWIDGEPVWAARGARNNGMEFIVDDGDDEPDEFDQDDADEGDDDDDLVDQGDGDDEPGDGDQRRRPRARKDDDGEDGGDGDGDPWEPPTREQWAKVEEALRRNNGENRKLRLTKKAMAKLGVTDEAEFADWLLDRGIDPESGNRLVDDDEGVGQGDDGQGKPEDAPAERRTREQIVLERRRAEERGAARTEARYRPAIVQFAAAAALAEAEYAGKDAALALRLFDMDKVDVEFDENGDPVVYGLDEQIKQIKEEFPQLFRRKRVERDGDDTQPRRNGRTSVGRTGARAIDGGDRGRTGGKPQGWLQQVDRQLMTGGR